VLRLAGATGTLPTPPAGALPPPGRRAAWFGNPIRQCPVFEAVLLPAEARISGPAFIEVPNSTVVVYPGQTASLDAHGHVRLEFDPRP
jgi:N-methylhydantoinase A